MANLLAVDAPAICPELLARLGQKDVFSKQPTLRAAAEAVIYGRLKKGNPPVPNLAGYPTDSSTHIEKFQGRIPETVSYGSEQSPVPILALGLTAKLMVITTTDGQTYVRDRNDNFREEFGARFDSAQRPSGELADVQWVLLPTGDKYFRPMDGDVGSAKSGRTMAASTVAEELKMNTIPRAAWGRVNGRLGSISDEAPGKPPRKNLKKLLAEGTIDRKSAYNCISVEFLVGNLDGTKQNLRLDSDGTLRVIDHDFAFAQGLAPVKNSDMMADPDELLVGPELPDFYTREFIANLRRWTARKIEQKLKNLITKVEVDGVIFRREIILTDVKLRPQAIFP